MLVCLVTASGGLAYEELKEYLRIEEYKSLITTLAFKGTLKGLLHIVNDSLADIVQSDRTEILYGTDVIEEKLLGLSFNITPFSFFQTNSRGAEVLYSKVREYIGDTSGQIVFDLYSGTGTIAQLAAAVAKKVVGVEIVEEAVAAAKENAKKNGLTNCTFLAGDVLKVLDDISEKPDMIILDPPRDGIHPKALSKIIDYGVKRIVYISCKPTSLARDLVPLRAAGYRILRSCSVDMFPHTANVESCVLLERVSNRKADSKL
jgi:23S rRNA (uracil-5-)-methyltransferase RumA